MLLETIILIVVATAVVVLASVKPQPIRIRRQPTRAEMIARLVVERDERDRW